jgi:DNA (cytosine-5)-methyltransferase 1
MKLQYGSLFAGVGGFDMGMEQAGYEPVFQVEWDKNCQKILHHHWPTVPKWGDVCDVNGADLPPCDVLIFGSPCQDLSVAGKRAGLQDGDRSSMFFEAVRIIKEMRDATNSIYPRATIWENVPGALSSNKGADFGVVLSSLADIGAITQEYAVLDAQYFRSTPQRRRRIFLVSIFDSAASERCPDPLLPLIQGSRGDFAKGRKARKDAARNAQAGIDPGGQWRDGQTTSDCLTTTSNEQRMPDKNRLQAVVIPNEIVGALCARDYKGIGNQYVDEGKLVVQEAVAEPIVYDGYNQKLDDSGIHRSLRIGRDSSDFVAQPIGFASLNGFGDIQASTEVFPVLRTTSLNHAVALSFAYDALNDVANNIHQTLRATQGSNGDFVAQPISELRLAVRRLTPLECERLQGWPDDHTRWTADGKEQADTNRYKQCGNGVASCVARWVGEQLRPVLETE